MIPIKLAHVATPGAEPYDPEHPHKQRETLCYILNQILRQAAQSGEEIDIDVTEAVAALSFTGQALDLPGFRVERSGRVISLVLTP